MSSLFFYVLGFPREVEPKNPKLCENPTKIDGFDEFFVIFGVYEIWHKLLNLGDQIICFSIYPLPI